VGTVTTAWHPPWGQDGVLMGDVMLLPLTLILLSFFWILLDTCSAQYGSRRKSQKTRPTSAFIQATHASLRPAPSSPSCGGTEATSSNRGAGREERTHGTGRGSTQGPSASLSARVLLPGLDLSRSPLRAWGCLVLRERGSGPGCPPPVLAPAGPCRCCNPGKSSVGRFPPAPWVGRRRGCPRCSLRCCCRCSAEPLPCLGDTGTRVGQGGGRGDIPPTLSWRGGSSRLSLLLQSLLPLASSISPCAHRCRPRARPPGTRTAPTPAPSRGRDGCFSPALASPRLLLGVPREARARCWYHSSFSLPVRPKRYRRLSLQSPVTSWPGTGTFLVPSSLCSSASCSSSLPRSASASSGRRTQMGYFLFHVRFRARPGGQRKTCDAESGGEARALGVPRRGEPPTPGEGPWRGRTHLGVGQVVAAVADEGGVGDFLLEGGSARDVALGVGELEGGPVQRGEHQVRERGVEKLGVVDVQLVHPALGARRRSWLLPAVPYGAAASTRCGLGHPSALHPKPRAPLQPPPSTPSRTTPLLPGDGGSPAAPLGPAQGTDGPAAPVLPVEPSG